MGAVGAGGALGLEHRHGPELPTEDRYLAEAKAGPRDIFEKVPKRTTRPL